MKPDKTVATETPGDPAGRVPVCMLVEDEATIALALEDEVRAAGYEVSGPFATCGAALIKLDRDRPDVAILDTVLKDGSCLELARELRRRGVPFLIFSGREEAHQNAPALAGAPWIVKPAEYETVIRAVEELARRGGDAERDRGEAMSPAAPVA